MKRDKNELEKQGGNGRYWWHTTGKSKCQRRQPKPGDVCPSCGAGTLAFDGLFLLMCNQCQQVAESGAFT